MTRIVISSHSGPPLEVEKAAFDAGFFPDYAYVRDAAGGAAPYVPGYLEDDIDALLATPTSKPAVRLKAAYDAGSKPWLQAVAGAFGFSFTSLTTVDSATGLPTAAAVQWPDGTTGTFTGTTDGSNGYTGYTVTWAGSTTKTVTASGITYDTVTGLALGPTTLTVA